MKVPLVSILLVLLGTVRDVNAQEASPANSREWIEVGGRAIRLPAPAGFERVDGLKPEADQMRAAALPATNRLLAWFDPIEGQEDPGERTLNAQVLRSLENQEIGERTFADMRQQTKKELSEAKAALEAEITKMGGNIEKALQDMTGVEAALNMSDVAMLGTFGEDPSSLGFSMAMNVEAKAGDVSSKSKSLVAAMIVPVNGRLLYLYANTGFNSNADRVWAESTVAQWRDAVLGANPHVEGPKGTRSLFHNLPRSALIGAGIGALAGLIGMVVRKTRKA